MGWRPPRLPVGVSAAVHLRESPSWSRRQPVCAWQGAELRHLIRTPAGSFPNSLLAVLLNLIKSICPLPFAPGPSRSDRFRGLQGRRKGRPDRTQAVTPRPAFRVVPDDQPSPRAVEIQTAALDAAKGAARRTVSIGTSAAYAPGAQAVRPRDRGPWRRAARPDRRCPDAGRPGRGPDRQPRR